VVFLGTPHHGSALAQVVTRLTGTSKPFVRQLLPCVDQIFKEFNQVVDISRNVISFFESTGIGLFNHVPLPHFLDLRC
jgi:hypothetical protein